MQAAPPFDAIPQPLRDRVEGAWREFAAGNPGLSAEARESLPIVWAASVFAMEQCLRQPQDLRELDEGALRQTCGAGQLSKAALAASEIATDQASLMRMLRRFRNREMLRIIWRDLAGWAELEETLADLSDLADACTVAALAWLEQDFNARHGAPRRSSGETARLVVLGLGKLGGRELNLSSDIDLIFVFNADGETAGPHALSAEEYFTRLSRALTRVLSEPTSDGFVFRVDTLLRPFGQSGPIAIHRDAAEQYYQNHGRPWERYALIKARPVAGDLADGEELLRALRPFVYRRYLDFSAFESLREMKVLIEQQLHQKGFKDNIKLGAGGIREIEFVVQAFQLIRGGHEPGLQQRNLLKALAQLERDGILPEFAVRNLREAYLFLRRVENRLQAWRDQQTHDLPAEPEPQAALALAMGFRDWTAFGNELGQWRRKVHQQFELVFAAPQARTADAALVKELSAVWEQAVDGEVALATLRRHGLRDATATLEFLHQMRRSALYRGLSESGRRRLSQLLPLLFAAVEGQAEPEMVLLRVLSVVEAIAGRVTYLALLVENPMALSQLVIMCAASPWITRQIARHPLLLDELLDPRSLYEPPARAELERELALALESLNPADLEAQMDLLRKLRRAWTLRVAAADVSGHMRLMVVSDHLTAIAEVIVQRALVIAWRQMRERHGRPLHKDGSEADFAVIAYGKLGGIELGYGSDLDLVFVHDGSEGQQTAGERPIDHGTFFTRLGQKLIHVLTAQMPSGIAFDVDMRLRPSGNSGLLVTSLEAQRDYQENRAWTWEHQALVRARAIAGGQPLCSAFEQLRHDVLCRPREPDALRNEIRSMRLKMSENLGDHGAGRFDLKHGRGGIIDIEFMVQYLILREASHHPALVQYSDNIRQLEGLSCGGVLGATETAQLADAYRAYRKRVHALTLQEQPSVVSGHEFAEHRASVSALWAELIEDASGKS